ncbi:MAG: glycosyltransferase family 2 protein [Pseudobutyrivibrio sp.]|nr:glycosyltransferase family 2 protein [Pseudobutyrivibrio sp.]
MRQSFNVVFIRFHLTKPNTILFQGFFPHNNPLGYKLVATIGGVEVPIDLTINEGNEVRRRYITAHKDVSREYLGMITLPSNIKSVKNLRISSVLGSKKVTAYYGNTADLIKLSHEYQYNFETSHIENDKIRIMGWSVAIGEEEFQLYEGFEKVPITVTRRYRKDVMGVYPEVTEDMVKDAGLEIEFPKRDYKDLRLTVTNQGRTYDLELNTAQVMAAGAIKKHRSLIDKLETHYKEDGVKDTIKYVFKKLKGEDTGYTYEDFLERFSTKPEIIAAQKNHDFSYEPIISIVVPTYNTPERYLGELIESCMAQTYEKWQLCLGDGSESAALGDFIQKKYGSDSRIVYRHLESNTGISGNTNAAMELATGDFIALCDHDDLLSPEAMYKLVEAINTSEDVEVIYTDEDKVDGEGKRFFEPSFKPDYSIDYLCDVNYICHLFAFNRRIYDKVGGFRSEFDGAQDHDFILRCCEVAKKVYHIPQVLYHWRCHAESTAMNAASKLYAFENGANVIKGHFDRLGIPVKVQQGEFYGTYHTVYQWEEEPLVSIIIPNKDHIDDLQKCIRSVDMVSDYPNVEYIIVENNSREPATFEYYEKLGKRDDVKVVYYEGSFNFSAINNYGAKYAKGKYLLLLNNDIEIISKTCIREMVSVCMRPDVGICGAMLYYPDNTMQHAGVVVGIGGIAGHMYVGLERSEPGYMFRAACSQNMSAVTAACLMTKAGVYEEVNGLTEIFDVAFNDIDYCLKVRQAGYLVVFNPHAECYHYESKSRGLEDTGEKVARFNSEIEKFEKAWPEILKEGDPYYNINLSVMNGWYQLRE